MSSYKLQSIYIETNLESVFGVEGKKNGKICYMTVFKGNRAVLFLVFIRGIIVKNMNFEDDHKLMLFHIR